ncbi:MAG TPA: YbfB/YjiJ family MFS transporter [Acetobacteraceae bacterium]|jgi:MFS family permease
MSAESTSGIAQPETWTAGAGAAFGGMLALAAGMGIGRFVYTPILPDMAAALGLGKSATGLIASANFIGYLAGALLAALPHLPGGRRAWFLAGLAASAVTTAAMALWTGMAAFLLLRFVGGVASAFVLVLGSALVLDRLMAVRRPRWAALHFAGVGVGIAASAVLVSVLHAAGAGWQTLWIASGALSAIAVPLVLWLVPETTAGRTSRATVAGRASRATVAGRASRATAIVRAPLPRGLRALTLCHGLFGFGYVVTATFLVAVVRGSPQAHTLEPVVWLAVGLAAAPSTALWGWIAGRTGPFRAYGIACVVEAFGVAAGGVWTSPAGALVAAVLLGGTFMGITALGFAAARSLGPRQERRSFAVITAGFGLGQIAGPSVAGALLDRTHSFAAPSLLAAAAVAAAAGVAWWLAARPYAAAVLSARAA